MSSRIHTIASEILSFGIERFMMDVDGVTLDSRRALAEFARAKYPHVPLHIKEDASRGWEALGIERAIYEEILHDPDQIALKKPLIPDVKEGFQILADVGFKVDLLSSIDPSMVEQRLMHLREDELPFGQLLTVPRDATKEEYLRENAPVILIDDYQRHIDTANQANCVGVFFSQPYNAELPGLRLRNWSQEAIKDMLQDVLETLPKLNLPLPRSNVGGKKPLTSELV